MDYSLLVGIHDKDREDRYNDELEMPSDNGQDQDGSPLEDDGELVNKYRPILVLTLQSSNQLEAYFVTRAFFISLPRLHHGSLHQQHIHHSV